MKLARDDVQSVVIPDAGHWLAEEAPDELLAALTAVPGPVPRRIGGDECIQATGCRRGWVAGLDGRLRSGCNGATRSPPSDGIAHDHRWSLSQRGRTG